MASILTIFLFFIYTWGLGFSVTYFHKKAENFFERNLMHIGIGLGVFAILSIIINLFRIPLDWKLFLVLSLIVPAYDLYKNKKINIPKIKLTKYNIIIFVVILISLASLYMYTEGAFSYTYLEDEDLWGHSIGVKYVALEKDAYNPIPQEPGKDEVLSYIDPYPPAYDILLGVLHQTSPSLPWTMKFFNALIISLGFIFFFFFARLFIRHTHKALFATIVFAAIPSYLSHFIWAHSLVITLFLPAMYAFEKSRRDKKWMHIAIIMVAAIWVSQNLSQPIKISTMIFLYLIVVSITQKKFFKSGFIALFGGMALSFAWWGAMVKKYTLKGFISIWQPKAFASETVNAAGEQVSSGFSSIISILKALTSPGGTGSRAYHFDDFFIAKGQNMINNPIGVGIVISLLVIIGLIYTLWRYRASIVKQENTWLCVVLFWLIFTFWGVNGQTFPISVARGPFRVWMLLAIPIALISVEGLYFIRSFFKAKHLKTLVTIIVIIGIFYTSAQQKYELNTVIWPTSGAFSPQEAAQYGEWFKTIPDNTNVFLYSPRDKLTIGFGMSSCAWCENVIDFRKNMLYHDAQTLHQFLKQNDYEYFIINGRMDTRYFNSQFGQEETQKLLQSRYNEFINSGLFNPVFQQENVFVVFKIQ